MARISTAFDAVVSLKAISAAEESLDQVLSRVADGAVHAVADADAVSITVLEPPVARTVAYTDEVQRSVDEPHEDPDLVVNVVGKQWAWDFNYTYGGEERHYAGIQAHLTGEEGDQERLPTLYLPYGEEVTFELTSRDVIHSFWIPQFLQKRDMVPGRTTEIHLVPQEEGSFDGKCAELCGEYHSEMLFNVEVVSPQEFEQYLETLDEGHLDETYDRNPNLNDVSATEGDD